MPAEVLLFVCEFDCELIGRMKIVIALLMMMMTTKGYVVGVMTMAVLVMMLLLLKRFVLLRSLRFVV